MTSRLRQNVENAVQEQLEPGERIEAKLPYGISGMSPWLMGMFGAVGALVFFKATRQYGVVVTDRRLLLVRHSLGMMKSSQLLEKTYGRAFVRVESYRPGTFYGKLVLTLPAEDGDGDRRVALSFQRRLRKDAEAVATALGGSPAR